MATSRRFFHQAFRSDSVAKFALFVRRPKSVLEKVINVILDAPWPDVSIIIGAFPARKYVLVLVSDATPCPQTRFTSALSPIVAPRDVIHKNSRFVANMDQGL